MKERIRELIDVPEKVAIGVGIAGVAVGLAFKKFYAFVNPGLLLITLGATSLLVTNAVWPKKS